MDTKVEDFERWLHREAYRVQGDLGSAHDDLVQEGRIAMWLDEVKNGTSHAGYMTREAALRMREVARGQGRQFGSEMRRVAIFPETAYLYDHEMDPVQADLADKLVLAYHRGEIREALDRLPPRQRQAAIKILTDGVLTPQERASWVDARKKLQVELDHLRGC
jgi:DNA-directed RNA polymerase specialized sigma24 family protein